MVKFGGPDARTIRFLDKYGDVFIAHWLYKDQARAIDYLRRERLSKLGRGWHGVGPDIMEELREACPNDGADISDQEVYLAFQYAQLRLQNYARIAILAEARVRWCRVENAGCKNQTCLLLQGKLLNTAVAADAIDRLMQMTVNNHGLELAKRVVSPKSPQVVSSLLAGEHIKESYLTINYAFPTFYPGCFCRVEGIIEK